MRRLALFAALALAAAAPAAAGVSVAAELDRASAAMGEQIVLSVTVSGDQASLPAPQVPPLEAFSVYDSGKSTQLSFVNGRVSASVVYSYALSPRSPGKFVIPPISAEGAAPTAPLSVEIVPAGRRAPPPDPAPAPAASQPPGLAPAQAPTAAPGGRRAPDVFVTATLDKTRAYVNEQVTLTIRFMDAVQLVGPLNYDPPELTGFLNEELPPVRTGLTTVGGRQYQYNEIKLALFPIQTGKLKIGSAAIHCQVARMGAPTSEDFFDRFFAMSAPQAVTVNSDPVTLTVEPLPAGKPDDFTGIVGRLTARATADRTEVKAGEAVNLTVAVTGTGNLKSLPEPKKPDLPSLRFFETESASTVDKTNDRIGGGKTFRTVVVPRVSGPVRVPPFVFSYFDPERRAYERAATAPLDLRVAPGAPGTPLPVAAPAAPGLTAIADDIRYLKTAPENAPVSAALAAFADLGPWHALPFAALLLAALAAWRRRWIESDPRGRRAREALARADARLKEAAALTAAEAARAAALVDEALAGFVADKLGAPAAGLTLKSALDGLKSLRKPPSDATLERLRAAWEEADLRRFAPGASGGDVKAFAEETAVLLKTLDTELRR